RILINGKPPKTDRRGLGRTLGLVPQSLALYPTLSAAQNVWHFARMQGLSRDDAKECCKWALQEVGLSDRAEDPVHAFSGGMKRLLNLACGIVHRPPARLLDVSAVGGSLQSREQILTRIRHYAESSASVMYTTHYMEEAHCIC